MKKTEKEIKHLLINVRNGALITPVLHRIMEIIEELRK